MAKTARAVQVPGEPTQELPTTNTTQELPTGAEGDEARPVLDADSVQSQVAALQAQLETERLARLEAEQRAAVATEQAAAAAKAKPASVVPAQGKATAATPQLTATGWVVPQTYGAPPVKV